MNVKFSYFVVGLKSALTIVNIEIIVHNSNYKQIQLCRAIQIKSRVRIKMKIKKINDLHCKSIRYNARRKK